MVTVIGLGFVGLTTALGLCEYGQTVFGIECNAEYTRLYSEGKLPFSEPHLCEKLNEHISSRFFIDKSLDYAVKSSEAVFFCVGTPYGENGAADLGFLFNAIDRVLECADDDKFRTLVIKSTVPPSTTSERIIPYIASKGFDVPGRIGAAANPEFLREGHCWEDFINADRIVIGCEDPKSEKILRDIYSRSGIPVFAVSYNTSEFIKYLSNASLACLISFANEMSIAADKIGGIDIKKAFDIVRLDKRWQTGSISSYFYPGCGYGGYCLPKDTNAMYNQAKAFGYDCRMLGDIIRINDEMPLYTADKIAAALNGKREKCIGILGLSFNRGSDDVRDTPAARIISALNDMGFTDILAYDPVASEKFRSCYPGLKCRYAKDMSEFEQADILVLVTVWDEFMNIRDFGKEIIDCRYALMD